MKNVIENISKDNGCFDSTLNVYVLREVSSRLSDKRQAANEMSRRWALVEDKQQHAMYVYMK